MSKIKDIAGLNFFLANGSAEKCRKMLSNEKALPKDRADILNDLPQNSFPGHSLQEMIRSKKSD